MSPQVIAHRGSSGAHAEHTLTAYELALQEGADALECDVRLTRDGVLVCVHDRRVDRTSDGRGVVSALELQQLDDLNFASWKERSRDPLLEAAWEEADTEGSRVLTLERLLQLVLDYNRTVQLHIETKHPTRYGALVERKLVDLLDRYGLAAPLSRSVSRVCVLSFSTVSLRRIHAMAPGVPTQLNMDRVPVRFRDGSLPPQVQTAGIALEIARAHPRYVARAHSRNHRVHVFTVDEPADIDFVAGLGVDGIISNHPLRVLRHLARA
ncbi:MAG TPA: glycerophosphodiester phosphodiesterase family protein [Mycobacteriales bacterium]|nr:glycerophosphodiester phosphodiesterase family protein [Mycobacteriales bacterium]